MRERDDYALQIFNDAKLDIKNILEAGKLANEKIAGLIDMDGILQKINQEYFEGRGKVMPAESSFESFPNNTENLDIRSFMRTKVDVESIKYRKEIDINGWLFEMDKKCHTDKRKHGDYKFGIYQQINFKEQKYNITLYFGNRHYYSDNKNGNFGENERPHHLYRNAITEILEFDIQNPPTKNELINVLNQNVANLFEKLKCSCLPHFNSLLVDK